MLLIPGRCCLYLVDAAVPGRCCLYLVDAAVPGRCCLYLVDASQTGRLPGAAAPTAAVHAILHRDYSIEETARLLKPADPKHAAGVSARLGQRVG